MKWKIDKFVLAIIGVIALAYLFPQWGGAGSALPLDEIGTIGVSLIFFFYGLKLTPEKLKHGLKNWKLHVVVQLSTFLLFPLLVLLFHPLVHSERASTLWLAFFFLAALPSTVSSSVVMVSMARGNVPAAIFNASISGLIGIAVTPLWMGLFLQQATQDFELGSIYLKLLTEILLPVLIGMALQKYFGRYALKYAGQLATFDKTIILIIIFKSFATSFEAKVFGSVRATDLVLITAGTVLLFFVVYTIIGIITKSLAFNLEDQVTARFCGTKKSLIHGTIFSKILFPAAFPVGIVLLPLMVFHALQLFIVSIIAARLAGRNSEKDDV